VGWGPLSVNSGSTQFSIPKPPYKKDERETGEERRVLGENVAFRGHLVDRITAIT